MVRDSAGGRAGGGTTAVAELGGTTVTKNEYLYYQRLVKDGTLQIPANRAALLRQIATDRALFSLAHHAGQTGQYRSLEDLLDARDAVNAQRVRAAAQGRPVYGDLQYDQSEYYARSVAGLRDTTITALSSGAHPRIVATDAEIRREFDAEPSQWAADATTFRFTTLTVPWTVGTGSGGDLLAKLTRAQICDLDQTAHTIRGAKLATTTIPADGVGSSDLDPDAQASLATLRPGQVLPPQTHHNTWVLYRLDHARVDPAAALRNYRPQLRQAVLDRKFDALLSADTATLLRHTT